MTYLHCCRFAGDGKASYIDRLRNAILYWSFFHSSENKLLRRLPSYPGFRFDKFCSSLFSNCLLILNLLCWRSYRYTIPFLGHCSLCLLLKVWHSNPFSVCIFFFRVRFFIQDFLCLDYCCYGGFCSLALSELLCIRLSYITSPGCIQSQLTGVTEVGPFCD